MKRAEQIRDSSKRKGQTHMSWGYVCELHFNWATGSIQRLHPANRAVDQLLTPAGGG
jgi:hypothetical protein